MLEKHQLLDQLDKYLHGVRDPAKRKWWHYTSKAVRMLWQAREVLRAEPTVMVSEVVSLPPRRTQAMYGDGPYTGLDLAAWNACRREVADLNEGGFGPFGPAVYNLDLSDENITRALCRSKGLSVQLFHLILSADNNEAEGRMHTKPDTVRALIRALAKLK